MVSPMLSWLCSTIPIRWCMWVLVIWILFWMECRLRGVVVVSWWIGMQPPIKTYQRGHCYNYGFRWTGIPIWHGIPWLLLVNSMTRTSIWFHKPMSADRLPKTPRGLHGIEISVKDSPFRWVVNRIPPLVPIKVVVLVQEGPVIPWLHWILR